jgi:antitoxin (DNA-binding transcriptional repressor) of toxin-antitoxin stability system
MNISATELMQHAHLLSRVKDEYIVLTKRDKPFAVIVHFEKSTNLINIHQRHKKNAKLEALNALGSYELGGKSAKEIKADMSHV